MRKISATFIDDLSSGKLQSLLARIRRDDTLLQVRFNSVNVYYRGSSIIHVIEDAEGSYIFEFDSGYFGKDPKAKAGQKVFLRSQVESFAECDSWLVRLPFLKDAIDQFFTVIKDTRERELQQQLVRENNSGGIGKGSDYSITPLEHLLDSPTCRAGSAMEAAAMDSLTRFPNPHVLADRADLPRSGAGLFERSYGYFACDIEWSEEGAEERARFDAVAVHWPSTSQDRKKADDRRLALVELKWGDNALGGPSGLLDHVDQANALVVRGLKSVKDDALFAFNLKQHWA